MLKRAMLPLCRGWVLGAAAPVFSAQVTFQVNLSAQTVLGTFDPNIDTVSIAGDIVNNWGASASPLTRSESNSN
jgi:hypothetical protein